MLDHRLKIINGLVNFRFGGLPRRHLLIQGTHLRGIGLRQRCYPVIQQLFFHRFVRLCFAEGGNIPGEGLPQVMDEQHLDHLIHIRFREFIPQEIGHQRRAPAVLRHTFVPAPYGVAVSGGVLQPVRHRQRIQ